MTDTATTTEKTAPTFSSALIAEAWGRAKALNLAYLRAGSSADPVLLTAMGVQLQSVCLLIAATPAERMDDLAPKVLCAALFRGPLAHLGAQTLALIEHGITLDMARLQPLDPVFAAVMPTRRTPCSEPQDG